ncbi:MAG TPA: Mth938-like domain-containing protein [Vineibacter sp.]|nr:Mth938-like domain-containing protein [Vineibacter sp.]
MSLPTDKTLPTPDPRERQLIQTYGPGRFRISDVDYDGAVLVLPQRTEAWAVAAATDIAPDNLAAVIAATPAIEVLVLGCGSKASFIPPSRRAALKAHGIVLEVMDTGAACRTYNVLLAEGRRVAAALVPV